MKSESFMKTKAYIKPMTDIFPLMGNCILNDGFSEDLDKAPEKDDIELDGNEYTFFDDFSSDKIWD